MVKAVVAGRPVHAESTLTTPVDEIRMTTIQAAEKHPPQSTPVSHPPATSKASTQQSHYHTKTDQTRMQVLESNYRMELEEDHLSPSSAHQHTSPPQTHPLEAESAAAHDLTEIYVNIADDAHT
jgi:hypothetical protein